MGPRSGREDISAVLAVKDRHIEYLETLLDAHAARNSRLQTRLHATLDTLDGMVRSHAQELSSEIRTKEKLSQKLDSYIDVVKRAESERDDIRDAILQLIEKVELTSDYSSWPYSRMQLTGRPDPILPNQDPRAKDSDNQQLSYATNLIASLRLERDMERASHDRTRHEADCRIAALEAQVASREAELQGYLALVDTGNASQRLNRERPFQTAHGQPTSRRHSSVHQHNDLPDVSSAQKETLRTSKRVSKEAQALETEVKGLFERLRLARSEPVPTQESRVVDDREQSPDSDINIRAPDGMGSIVNHSPLPPSPRCIHMVSVSPNLSDFAGPPFSPCPHPRDYTESFSSHSSPPSPSHETLNDVQASPDDSHTIMRHVSHPVHMQPSPAILDLERQVIDLAAKVDAFKEEREILARVLAEERQEHSAEAQIEESVDLVQLAKEGRTRLGKSEETLRYELEVSKRAAMEREKELLEEIERLREANQRDGRGFTEQELLLIEEYDGELSMELATPLHPTSILPTMPSDDNNLQSTPHPTSTLLSPLSPLRTHSPPYQSTPRLEQNRDLAEVEEELAVAKRRLENGEEEVRQLQLLAEELRQRISDIGAGEDGGI